PARKAPSRRSTCFGSGTSLSSCAKAESEAPTELRPVTTQATPNRRNRLLRCIAVEAHPRKSCNSIRRVLLWRSHGQAPARNSSAAEKGTPKCKENGVLSRGLLAARFRGERHYIEDLRV